MVKTGKIVQHFCGMRSMLVPLFVTLILALISVPTNAAPQRKDPRCPAQHEIDPCSCRQTTALHLACQNINPKRLFDVLGILREEEHLPIKTVEISHSDLHSIPDDAFTGLQIEELFITNTNLTSLEKDALTPLGEYLQKLDLTNNRLREVPTDSLSRLNSLKVLDLSNNKIEQLKDGDFSGMEALEELHLKGNDISLVNNLAFKDCCSDLLILNMANNLLSTIEPDAFVHLSNLSVLKLQENIFRNINKGAFNGLSQLNTLDLSNNQISALENGVFSSSSIHSVILKNNNITELPDMAFAGLESTTEWLDLSYNHLERVPSDALAVFGVLRHLDLSHNKITELQDNCMVSFGQHLRYIELNNNNIHHISPKAFQEMSSVEFLMLAHNHLTAMTYDTVQSIFDTLYLLDLSENPLVCGCELQWLKEWLDTVNLLDRFTPDPTCFRRGTKTMKFVRQLTCHPKNEVASPSDANMCLNLDCMKTLASMISKRIWWY